MRSKSVAVIGAGIGGIVAATHLAQHGLKVTVLEKNSRPGGRCDRLERDGHHFDTGPTMIILKLLYDAEFRALGASLHDMVDLQRVDPGYRLVFDDGSQFSLASDMKSIERQVETFETGSFQGLLRYIDEGRRHYQIGTEKLVTRDFRKASDFFSLKNIPLVYQLKPFVNHYRNIAAYFNDPRLKSAFTFQDVYIGLSPFEASAIFSMIPYSEMIHGVWYPKGGMFQLVGALVKLAHQAGVEFNFNTAVERIETEGNTTRGVLLEGGEHLHADIVLANADLPYVYKNLLPVDGMNDKLARQKYSCSTISYFWGLDKTITSLGLHTIFLPDDYRQNFDSIIRDHDLPSNPALYLHAPARLDPAMAPFGQDTLIAIVPVGHMCEEKPQDWEEIRDQAREKIFDRLAKFGINGIKSHIKFEISYTPALWQKRYNLVRGATHGLSHNLLQMAYFRPHHRHARYHNLYFVGASTHPGTGLPSAMISGRLVANRIIDELNDE
ncbi:MAG: phytoene desaturase family protein [Anaerolineaceae bacterium]